MDNSGENIVFIGGVPRSGTTLIQKILDMHSEVYAGPEFDHLPVLSTAYKNMKMGLDNGRQEFYYDENQLQQNFRKLLDELLMSKRKSQNVKFLSEKTPGNVLCFSELKELYPRAYFIYVVRDPRAVINSLVKVGKKARGTTNTVGVGKNVFNDVQLIHNYTSAGDEFYSANKSSCFLLHYEDLVSQTENKVKEVCQFLGLIFEETMLDISKENDSSKLVNSQNETVKAWSEPGDLEREITDQHLLDWKKQLPNTHKLLIDSEFYNSNYKSYNTYQFNRVSPLVKFGVKGYLKFHLWMKRNH